MKPSKKPPLMKFLSPALLAKPAEKKKQKEPKQEEVPEVRIKTATQKRRDRRYKCAAKHMPDFRSIVRE